MLQDLKVHKAEKNQDTVLEVAKAADVYTVATKFIAHGVHNGNGTGDKRVE